MLFLQFQKPEIHQKAHFCPSELAKYMNFVMQKRTVYIRSSARPFTFDNFQMKHPVIRYHLLNMAPFIRINEG